MSLEVSPQKEEKERSIKLSFPCLSLITILSLLLSFCLPSLSLITFYFILDARCIHLFLLLFTFPPSVVAFFSSSLFLSISISIYPSLSLSASLSLLFSLSYFFSLSLCPTLFQLSECFWVKKKKLPHPPRSNGPKKQTQTSKN